MPPPSERPPEPTEPATSDLEPCELVTPESLAPIGGTFQAGAERASADARLCIWANSLGRVISIAILDETGLAEAEGTPGEVGGRESKQNYDGGWCVIVIGVGETSRVDVMAPGDSEAKTCTWARQAAEIVEPNLP